MNLDLDFGSLSEFTWSKDLDNFEISHLGEILRKYLRNLIESKDLEKIWDSSDTRTLRIIYWDLSDYEKTLREITREQVYEKT